jgi:hypothetical protein
MNVSPEMFGCVGMLRVGQPIVNATTNERGTSSKKTDLPQRRRDTEKEKKKTKH